MRPNGVRETMRLSPNVAPHDDRRHRQLSDPGASSPRVIAFHATDHAGVDPVR
jgi:hypothetical protein